MVLHYCLKQKPQPIKKNSPNPKTTNHTPKPPNIPKTNQATHQTPKLHQKQTTPKPHTIFPFGLSAPLLEVILTPGPVSISRLHFLFASFYSHLGSHSPLIPAHVPTLLPWGSTSLLCRFLLHHIPHHTSALAVPCFHTGELGSY